MKKIFNVFALMSAIALLVTACTKDETLEPQVTPALDGSEIIFGSRAGFENANPGTRTIYSGDTYDVTVGDVTTKFERIDWVTGDQIEIYCPEASNGPTAHYSVTQQSVDENGSANVDKLDEGYLTKISDNALQWNGDGTHTFYAMYPSTWMIGDPDDVTNTLAQGIKMNEKVLTGIVPHAQRSVAWKEVDQTYGTGESAKTTKKYYAMPDMRYAYMAAKSTATRDKGSVSLNFVPVVTALEVELQAQNVPVTISEIMVEGEGIAGSFTADLGDTWTGVYPVCKNEDDANLRDFVQFTLHEPKTLAVGESLIFTVFLRPGAVYENVTVGFSQTGAGYLKNMLGNDTNKVVISKTKKTVVTDFYLPKEAEDLVIDASRWMEQLPDATPMGYLSLPGTGGSFSANYNEADAANYKQQTLSLADQWKAGIRAFEVVVDRKETGILFWVEAGSLADNDVYVKCNKKSMGITFATAMNDICNLVKANPDECAVVTIVYQPEGGSAPGRNSSMFAESLALWWQDATTQTGMYDLYTPDAQLSKLRGKVLVLVRMDQQDEGDDGDISTAMSTLNSAGCPFVVVQGCGTAKDRWGARGYAINDVPCPHISNEFSSNDRVIEYHMEGSKYLSFDANGSAASALGDYTITRPVFGQDGAAELNFRYETNQDFACWYQDWARVVSQKIENAAWTYDRGLGTGSGNITWFESLEEKMSNIEQTFLMAINSDPTSTVDTPMIYVNSLCGYLVDAAINDSVGPSIGLDYGGSGGNINGLANEVAITVDGTPYAGLNAWFSQMVFDMGLEQTTGPTGVIYMDRVTADMEVIGRIISNNFKFSTK